MEEFKILSEIIKELYSIDPDTLISKSRKRDLVELRYVCVNILRSETKHTVTKIGEELNIDHSTVCYALDKHQEFMGSKNYRNYSNKYSSILESYYNKIQTPERLKIQIQKLEDKKVDIQNQIIHLKSILETKTKQLELEKNHVEA